MGLTQRYRAVSQSLTPQPLSIMSCITSNATAGQEHPPFSPQSLCMGSCGLLDFCVQHLRGKEVASVPSQTYSVACLACAGSGPPAWPGTSTDSTCTYRKCSLACGFGLGQTPLQMVSVLRRCGTSVTATSKAHAKRLGWSQHPQGQCCMTGHSGLDHTPRGARPCRKSRASFR